MILLITTNFFQNMINKSEYKLQQFLLSIETEGNLKILLLKFLMGIELEIKKLIVDYYLIVVTDEKKIRIMTGKWMELEFPDSYCRDIIESELRWLMNSWKYDELIESWYELSSKERTTKTWVRWSKESSTMKNYKNNNKMKR